MQQLITKEFIQKLIDITIQPIITRVMLEINLEDSFLARQIKAYQYLDSIIVSLPPQSIYVDRGRSPGKKPPMGSILKWIKEKNINSNSNIDDKQLAFAIANTIAINGIKPKPFIDRLKVLLTEIISEKIKDEILKNTKSIITNKS